MAGELQSCEEPRLSVIVPVYNAEPFLSRALKSIVECKEKSLEIICVNDGSTDQSLSILNRFAEDDSRIVIIDQPNGGVSEARNVALRQCRGKYVIFVDADDEVTPDYFSELLTEADNHDADLVISGFKIRDSEQEERIQSYDRQVYKAATWRELIKLPLGVCSHLYKRDSLLSGQTITQFPKGVRYGEDTAFHYAVYPYIRSVVVSEECGYIIHEIPNSASKNGSVLVSDMPDALLWLKSMYDMKGVSASARAYFVWFAAHVMKRIFSLSGWFDIKSNVKKLRKVLVDSNISQNDLDVLPNKLKRQLICVLKDKNRMFLRFYVTQLKHIFRFG